MEREKNKLFIQKFLELIHDSYFTIKRFNIILLKN